MHTLESPVLTARMKAEQFKVQEREARKKILSLLTTRDLFFLLIPRGVFALHRGRLAFTCSSTFFKNPHTPGVYLCSHERALQSQMCEESVNKLGVFFSFFPVKVTLTHTHRLCDSVYRMSVPGRRPVSQASPTQLSAKQHRGDR